MTYFLTYQIKGINGQFIMPINQNDDVKFVTARVKKEFGIIPNLTARIYGSNLQSSKILSQCVRGQDVVTFVPKETSEGRPKLEMYREPIITPKYRSKTTFIVFTTYSFESMTVGNKIKVDLENDTNEKIQKKIKDMFKKIYKKKIKESQYNSMKILVFLPGGIPFLKGTIGDFANSFPDFMPHLYAIIIYDKNITDKVLEEKYENVCNINDKVLKSLISPDTDGETCSLCEIAAVLGYIQQNGQNVKRMIYSIAKFCPFAPMICGLYNLSCMSRVNGMTIVQITAPLIRLFEQMRTNLPDQDAFSNTVKFMTYFMNIKISDRVPCTEFVRPFFQIGYENYFFKNFADKKYSHIDSIIAFDPDFRDIDWIKFKLPSLQEEDLENAMKSTKTLEIIPPMSLRKMHRVSLFQGTNGPWLFITASISKQKSDEDKIEYINPEVGKLESGKYEEIAAKTVGVGYATKSEAKRFDEKVISTIDPDKVTQLVFICFDKSLSMGTLYDQDLDRFQAAQKFFVKFTQACYKFHTTSLYGSVMFNHEITVRNYLNPLASNFAKRMTESNDQPTGGTAAFRAIKQASNLMLESNLDKLNGEKRYPNAVLRIIIISDGEDRNSTSQERAEITNFLVENQIRVDSIIVSADEIAKELVFLSHQTGGAALYINKFNDGIELFNKEEFFNVDLRQFDKFCTNKIIPRDYDTLKPVNANDLNDEIKAKPSEYANNKRIVTSPKYAISEFNKEIQEQMNDGIESNLEFSHSNQKRIINELRKIVNQQDSEEDIRVFPLKDRIDVWRVLIKGFEGSLYDKKWFYMIIEFPPEYPEHYPLFRFVFPPFHPNITDQGRVCIDTLDKRYRSDKSIIELIGEVRYLLFEPNFDSCVDLKREAMKNNQEEFKRIVNEWNDRNAKEKPEDWIDEWNIQEDGILIPDNVSIISIPDQFVCPISRKIMEEPVKATSGIFYEKRELEKYVNSNNEVFCRGKTDENGKPIKLDKDANTNLPVDKQMLAKIARWKRQNGFIENEDVDNENDIILEFRKKGEIINKPIYDIKCADSKNKGKDKNASRYQMFDHDNMYSQKIPARPRPELSEK